MKFIFADSLDLVDPGYDFVSDCMHPGRRPYWDDQYPHELFGYAPYDGILVSRGIVGDHQFKGKYTSSQAMRFKRVGARKFLRFNGKFGNKDLFGDSGAFSYVAHEVPPYTSEDMVEFYGDGQFTHGCSVDHVIFDFERSFAEMQGGSEDAKRRFEITLENAGSFLKASRGLGSSFTALGVVQGWSPGSMGQAAAQLEKMGYTYLALGGMVPLNATSVHACLQAVRGRISARTQLHLLGFAKAEQIHEFAKYGIASFDTTSPLVRAFKDARANYYVTKKTGGIDYYAAIRVPQALESTRLLRGVKEGRIKQEALVGLEANALRALREFDRGQESTERTVDAVLAYSKVFLSADSGKTETENEKALLELRNRLQRVLDEKPWKECACSVCKAISIEVLIFRGNNRNRRRGFHNLAVFHQHVKSILTEKP